MTRRSKYFQKLLNVPGAIEPVVLETLQQCSVNTALDKKPTIDEMVIAIKGQKIAKHPVKMEFQQKYGNMGSQYIQRTAPMNRQNVG